jgi:hypothetical protein
MTVAQQTEVPKPPRWISTEAGQWAWCEHLSWRGHALSAFSVQERLRLLQEAETLRDPSATTEDHS